MDDYFKRKIPTKYTPECQSYLLGIFLKPNIELAGTSLTLVYHQAQLDGDFGAYQRLGNWIVLMSEFPGQKTVSPEYYCTLGQNCYYHCFRLLKKQWVIFEELSDNLPNIIESLASISKLD